MTSALSKPISLGSSSLFAPRVSTQTLVVFTRQMASLLRSGISLADALVLVTSVSDAPALKRALADVSRQVQGGQRLGSSLRRHPKVFSETYVAMVDAGEEAGRLEEILERLSTALEKLQKLKDQIRGASIYPIVVTVVALAITLGLTVFVVPVFQQLFEQAGMALPLPTQLLIAASKALRQPLLPLFVLLITGLAVVAWRNINRNRLMRYQLDRLILRLPVFGPFIAKSTTAAMLRVLATLLDSGIPLTDALAIASGTVRNRVFRQALREARAQVAIGRSLSGAFIDNPMMPPLFVRLLTVGEQSGDLFSMLNRAATIYEEEVELAVKVLTSLLEPAFTILISVLVGFILLALYMPVFNIGNAFLKIAK